MLYRKNDPFYFTLLFLLVLISCSQPEKKLEEKQLVDDPATQQYPMPKDAHERDEVFVGRLRRDAAEALDGVVQIQQIAVL